MQFFREGGTIITMTPEEKAQKINEIYENAIAQLQILKQKRKDIIKHEIEKAEAEEIEKIRASLLSLSNNQ